ncbi:uncharacterized protein [Rutidosis leptorrhynchoides]|uniref:uncharacterized protein n=1 Tax=Rutidosis leptorrhynchoides TaxID=125765 RepID=UPI003A996545
MEIWDEQREIRTITTRPNVRLLHITLKEKLKKLKCAIKIWAASKFNHLEHDIKDLKEKIISWELNAELCTPSDFEVLLHQSNTTRLMELEKTQRSMMKQMSIIKWVIEGDENSSFFHASVKMRHHCNGLSGISKDGISLSDPVAIKNAASEAFASRFKETNRCRPSYNSSSFNQLSNSNNLLLEGQITKEEIKDVVLGCASSKAPGPRRF